MTRPLLLALLVAIASCREPTETTAVAPVKPLLVEVVHPRRGDMYDVITVPGETLARTVLRLAAPISGRVVWMPSQPGDRVTAGTVVARVRSVENEAGVRGFAALDAAGVLGKEERRVTDRLQDQLNASDVALRATFDSVVAERLHNPGEQVAPGDVLLELFDPRSLYAVCHVPIEGVADLVAGAPVVLKLAGGEIAAHFETLLSVVTPTAVTVPARVVAEDPVRPPLLNAAVVCDVQRSARHNALILPRSALIGSTIGDRASVMVVDEGIARARSVGVGLRTSKDVEIADGLTDTDVVIASGQSALAGGERVEPAPAASVPQ